MRKLAASTEDVISSPRLQLIPQRKNHADAMYPLLAATELYDFTGDSPPESPEALQERFRLLESRRSPDNKQWWLNWVLQDRNDELVGFVQATIEEDAAALAWLVGLPWQGNGYASEAALALANWLKQHGVSWLTACIHPRHIASQRVAQSIGLLETQARHEGETVWQWTQSN